MKSLIISFFLVNVSVSIVCAQAPQPKKGDNVVLVQTADSADVALKKLGQAFAAQGFAVERYEPQLLTLALVPKTLPNRYNTVLVARAAASAGANSVLTLSGDYKGTYGTIPLVGIAEFKGSENGANVLVFRTLEKVALAYPGGKVTYGKQ